MTDIPRDFEGWYKDKSELYPLALPKKQLFDAYQAGRAHDVDGLIAEIEGECISMLSATTIAHNNALKTCIEIIRKHFGREE